MNEEKSNILIKGADQIQPAAQTDVVENNNTEVTPEAKVVDDSIVDNLEENNGSDKNDNTDVTPKAESSTEIVTPSSKEETQPVKSKADLLAEYGLNEEELESLRKDKEAKAQPPIEEKAFADLVNFAITKKLATKDEILQYENVQKQDDTALVYDKFKSEKLASDSALNEEEIKAMFDEEYFIGDTNEKRAKQGQLIIAQEASEIKSPVVGKFENLKMEFVKQSNISNFISQQETIVGEFNKYPIKASVNINGENVELEFTPNISIAELQKHLSETEEGKVQNNILFSAFIENRELSDKALGNLLSAMAAKKMEQQKLDAVAKVAFEKAEQLFKDKSPGVKAAFKAKEDIVSAQESQQVDEVEQWKRFKNK